MSKYSPRKGGIRNLSP